MPNDFVTVDYLATFAGMVLALALIVQFTKGLVKRTFADEVVRLYTFVWALVLVGLVYWYQGLFTVILPAELAMMALLVLVNAIVVALAAMGGYEVLAHSRAEKHPDTTHYGGTE